MAKKFLIGDKVKLTSKLINLDDIYVYSIDPNVIGIIVDIKAYAVASVPSLWIPPSQKGAVSNRRNSLMIQCATIDFDDEIYQLRYKTEIPEDDEEYENIRTFFCPTIKRWKYVFDPDFSIVKQIIVPIRKLVLAKDIELYESLLPGDLITYGAAAKIKGIVLSNTLLHKRKNRLLTNNNVKVFVSGKIKSLSPKTKIMDVMR